MESARWLKEKASDLIEAKAYDEAAPYLERLVKMPGVGPYDLSFAHFMLGEIDLYNSRFRSAQKHLKISMEITGDDLQGLLLIGQAYLGGGKPAKAREALEKARQRAPDDEIVEMSLALSMCMTGEFEEAEEVYQRCVKANPDRAEAIVGLAQAFVGQARLDDARALLDEAVKKMPMSLALRRALKELDKFDEARDFCDWLIHENPDGFEGEMPSSEDEVKSWVKTLLVEYRFPPKAFRSAETLLNDYGKVDNFVSCAPETFAGSVVYVMAKIYDRDDVSQKGIADRVGISPGGISALYRKIMKALNISKGDKRYL